MSRQVRVLLFSENLDFRNRAEKYLLRASGQRFRNLVFLTEPTAEADVVIVLDTPRATHDFRCRDGFLWFWQIEPNLRTDYLGGYDRIFGPRDSVGPYGGEARPPMTDWFVDKSFDFLQSEEPPKKTREISLVSSRKSHLPGHRLRNRVFDELEREIPELDVFGSHAENWVKDKSAALEPYKYSVVVENIQATDYITEKIVDCFLSFTLPIYFGAPNISDYYPADSMVILPSLEAESVVSAVRSVLAQDPWESRLDSIVRARHIFLENFSIVALVLSLVGNEPTKVWEQKISTRRIYGAKSFWINFDYSSSHFLRHNLSRLARHHSARRQRKIRMNAVKSASE